MQIPYREQYQKKIGEELVYLKELRLANNQLNGTLPGTLQYLTDLSIVSLNGNSLQGAVSGLIQSAPAIDKLKHIDLSSNNFTGTIPDIFVFQSPLEKLFLNNNQFNGTIPQSLYSSPSLQKIDLSNNQL